MGINTSQNYQQNPQDTSYDYNDDDDDITVSRRSVTYPEYTHTLVSPNLRHTNWVTLTTWVISSAAFFFHVSFLPWLHICGLILGVSGFLIALATRR